MRGFFAAILLVGCTATAFAQYSGEFTDLPQKVNLNFQATYVYQYKPSFRSQYEGVHSLKSEQEKENTLTATLYFGARLWKGAAIFINPEVASGSGLSGACGLAAGSNGESYRVGDPAPTVFLARGYFQQTFTLDKDPDWTKHMVDIDEAQNQLRGKEPDNYFRIIVGRYGLSDFFDNNVYSNSPRTQFLNWAFMNNAAWDFAADVRGYTNGAVAICNWHAMTYTLGFSQLPTEANGEDLNKNFSEAYALNAQAMYEYQLKNKPGHIRLLGYYNTANMGNYKQALQQADSGEIPNIEATKKFGRSKAGLGLNIDQQIEKNIGLFMRIGWNDGQNETWCYTEADRTYTIGMLIDGDEWKRKGDNLGIAVAFNTLAVDHRKYLDAGGISFELGDGGLSYGSETGAEVYYNYKFKDKNIWLTGDYQLFINPGYNKDRGPASVFSFRVHVEL